MVPSDGRWPLVAGIYMYVPVHEVVDLGCRSMMYRRERCYTAGFGIESVLQVIHLSREGSVKVLEVLEARQVLRNPSYNNSQNQCLPSHQHHLH